MTPRELMAAFEVVADAPEGVKRLRELVLSLAVRGKLVGQEEGDEPATALLTAIARGRVIVEESLKLRKTKPSPTISEDEIPFSVPDTWRWCRLQDLGIVVAGGTPPSGDASNFCDAGGFPWLTPADMRTWTKGKYIERGDRNLTEQGLAVCSAQMMPAGTVIFSSRAPIGYVAIAANPLSTNQGFKSIVPALSELSAFLHVYLIFAAPHIDKVAPGTTFKEVSGAFMGQYPIPLPPLAEQHRIVARVDELMALLDRLESAHKAREEARRAARDAALAALRDAEDADAVETAWARIAGEMDTLITEPTDVQHIRDAVRLLAVRGFLLSTDTEVVRTPRLGQLVRFLNGYAFKSEWYTALGVGVVRNVNVSHGTIDWTEGARVPEAIADEFCRFQLFEGDIVLSLDRPIIATGLKIARIRREDLPSLLLQRVACPRPVSRDLDMSYLYLWFNSPDFISKIDPGRSNGVPHISTKQIEAMLLRVPPLPEQHRIVAKVDALMALCDTLEARLRAARELHAQLAAAAVHHLDV